MIEDGGETVYFHTQRDAEKSIEAIDSEIAMNEDNIKMLKKHRETILKAAELRGWEIATN